MKKLTTLAFLTVPAIGASFAHAQDANQDPDEYTVIETTLEAVRANPYAFRNVRCSFTAQFCSIGRVANPFFTRFEPGVFANFYVWGDNQEIWQRKQYDNLFGMMFLNKSNPQVEDLYELTTYDRVRVEGVVQSVFQGQPWIEVDSFEVLPEAVNTATLSHMHRAEMHMARRQWQRAISELSLAPVGPTPNYVKAAVNRNLGKCYLRLGEAGLARNHLAQAKELQDDRRTNELVRLAETNPEQGLDRTVDRTGLGEADRPMWEAFETETPAPSGR